MSVRDSMTEIIVGSPILSISSATATRAVCDVLPVFICGVSMRISPPPGTWSDSARSSFRRRRPGGSIGSGTSAANTASRMRVRWNRCASSRSGSQNSTSSPLIAPHAARLTQKSDFISWAGAQTVICDTRRSDAARIGSITIGTVRARHGP